ncbi:MAG: multiubiquitin domain-containing protein [Solirubrobacterales bacterium]
MTAKKPHHVVITIDGVKFTLNENETTASELIRLAGLDPNRYDLAEVGPKGTSHRLADAEVVHLKNGEAFVTVRQSAPVA